MPVLAAFAVIGAAFVPAPYYGYAPGSATPTEALVRVEGVESYPSQGEVDFLSISVRHLSLLGTVAAWLDPEVDVVTERQHLGDRTPAESRRENLRLMGTSKDFAVYVALTRLGEPVTLLGGGAVVTEVFEGTSAAARLKRGDVIIAIDGAAVHIVDDIRPLLDGKVPGDQVRLTIDRPADLTDPSTFSTVEVDVTLAADPDDATRPIIGLKGAGTRDTLSFQFPFDVSIDSGNVGGPSAGLAFTLAVMDVLTPGELTGGAQVAATGEIALDGSVLPIGGIRQKTTSVIRSGAEVFLVPRLDYPDALDVARGSGLRVEAVDTIDDALAVLAGLGGNAAEVAAGA